MPHADTVSEFKYAASQYDIVEKMTALSAVSALKAHVAGGGVKGVANHASDVCVAAPRDATEKVYATPGRRLMVHAGGSSTGDRVAANVHRGSPPPAF